MQNLVGHSNFHRILSGSYQHFGGTERTMGSAKHFHIFPTVVGRQEAKIHSAIKSEIFIYIIFK